MSAKEDVRRARTLLRVAEVERRRALLELVRAQEDLARAEQRVEQSRIRVREVSSAPAVSGADLMDRQSRSLLAASALAFEGQQATACALEVQRLTDTAAQRSVSVRGRERLLDRRLQALTEEQLRYDQRLADESGQLGYLRRREEA